MCYMPHATCQSMAPVPPCMRLTGLWSIVAPCVMAVVGVEVEVGEGSLAVEVQQAQRAGGLLMHPTVLVAGLPLAVLQVAGTVRCLANSAEVTMMEAVVVTVVVVTVAVRADAVHFLSQLVLPGASQQ